MIENRPQPITADDQPEMEQSEAVEVREALDPTEVAAIETDAGFAQKLADLPNLNPDIIQILTT